MEWIGSPLVIRGYPIPPPDNQLKMPVRRFAKGQPRSRYGRVLTFADTPEYTEYKSAVNIWRMKYITQYADDLARVVAWFRAGRPLGIIMDVRVHHTRLFTQEHRPRKWDVTNLCKAVHDTFALVSGIDDSAFFECHQRKVQIEPTRAECVYLHIGQIQRSVEK